MSVLTALANWLSPARALGEQDLERQDMRTGGTTVTIRGSGWYTDGLAFDTTRVNYAKALALYRNTLAGYKLGAGFARPIINATAGFTGTPTFTHSAGNPAAQEALDLQFGKWQARMLVANRNALRDGDVYVRLNYVPDRLEPERFVFAFDMLVPDWCTPVWDPVSGLWQRFEIRHPVHEEDPTRPGMYVDYTVLETLTASVRTLGIEGSAPDWAHQRWPATQQPNNWGFVPIVHYRNEPEDHMRYGVSDLEPLEPLFKAYHETMLVGNQGIQLFAKPKVKLVLKNIQTFLSTNFPGWAPGQPLDWRGHEILLFQEGDDAAYITADPGTAGVTAILELLFYCIVQTGQVPEFILGTAVASSKASVSEQMPAFIKAVERKRGMLVESYEDTARMYLLMAGKVGVLPQLAKYDVDVVWPEITARDELSIANTINTLVAAFATGVQAGIVSPMAASEFLRDYVPTMLPFEDESGKVDEMRRILAGRRFLEQLDQGPLAEPTAPEDTEPTDLAGLLRQVQQSRNGATGG